MRRATYHTHIPVDVRPGDFMETVAGTTYLVLDAKDMYDGRRRECVKHACGRCFGTRVQLERCARSELGAAAEAVWEGERADEPCVWPMQWDRR